MTPLGHADRPNVVCVLADDLGWHDLGSYGSPFYETPNLDRLAREGTRFTDAYAAAPVCSPTRASVMTGSYPARVGVTDWIDFWGETHPARGALIDAGYTEHLPHDQTSLAAALRTAGYGCWHVGKWHLGGADQDSLPTDHGFDTNVGGCEWGAPTGEGGYFLPWEIPTLDEPPDSDRYLPDRLGDGAVELIEDHDGDEPFFLYYAPYLVHTPLQAPSEMVEQYETKRRALGLEDVREFEVGRQHPTEHKRDKRIKRRLVQSDPTYAAMVEALDRVVGRLLNALERTGRAEDTVVVFTSDHGEMLTDHGHIQKWTMYDEVTRVPAMVWSPGRFGPDTVEDLISLFDLGPTVLELADAPVDDSMEAESLVPALEGDEGWTGREVVFAEHARTGILRETEFMTMVRTDDWKLVHFVDHDEGQLFDLNADPEEEENLWNDPEVQDVKRDLVDELLTWRIESGVETAEWAADWR